MRADVEWTSDDPRGAATRAIGTIARRTVLALALLALSGIAVPVVSAAQSPAATVFALAPANAPAAIVDGPDGALWFTERNANEIGRITITGEVSQFPIPSAASNPWAIALGPDGRLWFTEADTGMIGSISPSGTMSEYPLPSGSSPFGITAGPDGRLWFTLLGPDQYGNLVPQVGAITVAGAVTIYPVPGVPANISPAVQSITQGPDGRLWFTEEDTNAEQFDDIGAITTSGDVTQYPLPEYKSLGVGPAWLTSGADGRVWFATDFGGTGLGAITTSGDVSYLTGPEVMGQPAVLGGGPIAFSDGRLWMAQGAQVAWVTPNLQQYGLIALPASVLPPCGECGSTALHGLTPGPDGRIWLTYATSNAGGSVLRAGILAVSGTGGAQCVVPELVGLTLKAARKRLKRHHCRLGRVRQRATPGKADRVLSQSPRRGRILPGGSTVAVTERRRPS